MRVCFELEFPAGRVIGAWWEIWGGELDCQYDDPISMKALLGVQTMLARPPTWSWHQYWDRLVDRISPLQWWEVGEVDDESYGYELLYHLETCHPRSIESEVMDPKYLSPDPEGTTRPDRP